MFALGLPDRGAFGRFDLMIVTSCHGSPVHYGRMTTVGIVGLGYVGLPLAVAFAQEGCEVIAVDVDARKVQAIEAGESYIEDVPSELLKELSGRIHPTTRYAALKD